MSRNRDSRSDEDWGARELGIALDWLVNKLEAMEEQGHRPIPSDRERCVQDLINDSGITVEKRVRRDMLLHTNGVVEWKSSVLLLPPTNVEHHFVAVLQLRRNRHGEDKPFEFSVQIAFYFRDDATPRDKSFWTYGFRFESPSPPSDEGHGKHNCYHVQLVKTLRGPAPDAAPLPISDREPTMPLPLSPKICSLDAAPVALLTLAVRSIYGPDEADDMIREVRRKSPRPSVKKVLDALHEHFSYT